MDVLRGLPAGRAAAGRHRLGHHDDRGRHRASSPGRRCRSPTAPAPTANRPGWRTRRRPSWPVPTPTAPRCSRSCSRATAVLADVQANDHRWLYVDPAGPTCALSREEIDFALSVPRNDALREALELADADPDRRGELVDGAAGRGHARRRARRRRPRTPRGQADEETRPRCSAASCPTAAAGCSCSPAARRPSRARPRRRWPSSRPPTCRTRCARRLRRAGRQPGRPVGRGTGGGPARLSRGRCQARPPVPASTSARP